MGAGEPSLVDPVWRARFAVVYAAANAAAIELAGSIGCGLRPRGVSRWSCSLSTMATLQTFVLVFAGLRVSALG